MTRSNLQGKVAIVTGGAGGIGSGIASRLAEDGCTVIVSYCSSRDVAEELVAKIAESGGQAEALSCDSRTR
jgi:3-oxoacyl-[acyl-carrier protein] reductase